MPADEAREGALVFARLRELYDQPVRGSFELDHLQSVHAYIFQDLPHHRPGIVRADTGNWTKNRVLEGQGTAYSVPYASRDVAAEAVSALTALGGPEGLKGLAPDAFAARMAAAYGALDRAHCFYEGNSRTLREFTRTLALEAGYDLDWGATGATAATRNRLYLARDVAVLDRAYPDLTEERAMTTNDRGEYEAWFLVRQVRGLADVSLQAIIREGLEPLAAAQASPGQTESPLAQQFARFREARAARTAVPSRPAEEPDPRPEAPRSASDYEPRP